MEIFKKKIISFSSYKNYPYGKREDFHFLKKRKYSQFAKWESKYYEYLQLDMFSFKILPFKKGEDLTLESENLREFYIQDLLKFNIIW